MDTLAGMQMGEIRAAIRESGTEKPKCRDEPEGGE